MSDAWAQVEPYEVASDSHDYPCDVGRYYRKADVDRARKQVEGEINRLRAERDERETPTCEFCGSAAEGGAMHVCAPCWNSANNDTWQRRAVNAEAEVVRLTQERDELVESDRFLQGQVVALEEEVARLTAARAAHDQQLQVLIEHWREAARTNEFLVEGEDRAAVVTAPAVYRWFAQKLAALLAAEAPR